VVNLVTQSALIEPTATKEAPRSVKFGRAFTPRFSYVIFDMDGTLVDTFNLITDAYNFAARDFLNERLSMKEVLSLPGRTLDEVLAANVPPANTDDAVERYHWFFEKNFHSRTKVFPGIRKLLVTMKRKGIKLAVFTGASRRTAQTTLRKSELADFFLRLVSADDVNQPKPNPEGLQIAMDAIGADPNKTVYVGDHPDDIIASRNARIRTAAALCGSKRSRELQALRPDFIFKVPSDANKLSAWSLTDLKFP